MRIFYEPTNDASIHQELSWVNTGLDEILEVGKNETGLYAIRSLIQFDIAAISASVVGGTIPKNASFDVKLYVARADDLNYQQQLEFSFVSKSWVEGTGYYYQNSNIPYTSSRDPQGSYGYTETNGVTWKNRFSGSLWSSSGSDFYTASVSSTIAQPVVDIVVDVTSMVRQWLSGSIVNNGIIIKFPTANELTVSNIGNIRFFSRNTHTVYSPQLIARWDDQIYISGTLTTSSPTDAIVVPKNLRPKYRMGSNIRIDLSVRDRYPLKTFDTVFSNYVGNQRLPSSSYFSVVDQQSNATIIPFDDYSKVSCDGSGSYFTFRTGGMYPGRHYKIIVKMTDAGYEQIYDTGHIFTIEAV